MATNRKLVFSSGEIYHVFNRSLDRRTIFGDKNILLRTKDLIKFYRHKNLPMRYSKILQLPLESRKEILESVYSSKRLIDIISYCLMPNHFHFLIKQLDDTGISQFISNLTNSLTRYSNIRLQRVGHLFEGVFKAVHIETEEQLIHVSRYIHLNPVSSSIISEDMLDNYQWSSYREYLSLSDDQIVEKGLVLGLFKSPAQYKQFVMDQIDYAKKLESIKHLAIE